MYPRCKRRLRALFLPNIGRRPWFELAGGEEGELGGVCIFGNPAHHSLPCESLAIGAWAPEHYFNLNRKGALRW
jgi:hypothetical protein